MCLKSKCKQKFNMCNNKVSRITFLVDYSWHFILFHSVNFRQLLLNMIEYKKVRN